MSGDAAVSGNAPAVVQGSFAHSWQATVLRQRPLVLPRRHYVYPREAEEVERGALELLVEPEQGERFLATCALGFADPLAPTGVWSCPHPAELCAVAGGYAYLIDTRSPERFEQLPYRPVLAVHPVATPGVRLLLFVGHQAICAHGERGLAWESARLSDEGVSVHSIADGWLYGAGWEIGTDRETPFQLHLHTGRVQRDREASPQANPPPLRISSS